MQLNTFSNPRLFVFALGLWASVMGAGVMGASDAHAQTGATTADQGGAAAPLVRRSGFIEYREELRRFVINVGRYARALNPDFKIIAEDALGLVIKPDPEDDTIQFPAKTFIRNIDGLLQREIATLVTKAELAKEAIQLRDDTLIAAQNMGLKVLALEFAEDIGTIDGAIDDDNKRAMVPFVARTPALSHIPEHPMPIFGANAQSVANIDEIQNFLYLENTQGFGSKDHYIQALRETSYDLVIVDVYHGRDPLTRTEVENLKFKKTGGQRLVLAMMDITTAASYLYYWQENWKEGSPAFIDAPLRSDPDRYRTHYWDLPWQSLFYGDANSYVSGIVQLGFDGVVIRGLNGWRYYETGEIEEEQDLVQ